MVSRLVGAVVWAVVAAAAAYWGLKLFPRGPQVPAHAVAAPAAMPAAADWTRLFGVEAAPVVVEVAAPPPDARFQLLGVVAPKGGAAGGVALIAIDGKPPRAFRVGAAVEGDNVLQAVQPRAANLGPRGGPVRVALQLPAAPIPSGGGASNSAVPMAPPTLPPPGAAPAAPVMVPPPAAVPADGSRLPRALRNFPPVGAPTQMSSQEGTSGAVPPEATQPPTPVDRQTHNARRSGAELR